MKYQIAKKPGGIEIEVSGVEGKKEQLLEAFRECQDGRCTLGSFSTVSLDVQRRNQCGV